MTATSDEIQNGEVVKEVEPKDENQNQVQAVKLKKPKGEKAEAQEKPKGEKAEAQEKPKGEKAEAQEKPKKEEIQNEVKLRKSKENEQPNAEENQNDVKLRKAKENEQPNAEENQNDVKLRKAKENEQPKAEENQNDVKLRKPKPAEDAAVKLRKPVEENGAAKEEAEVKLRQPADPSRALQKGLETLAESQFEEEAEEFKKIDNQLDTFSKHLDQVEVKMRSRNSKVEGLLENQRAVRLERRRSFHQRIKDTQADDDDFRSQVERMLSKCHQLRRASAVGIETGASGTS